MSTRGGMELLLSYSSSIGARAQQPRAYFVAARHVVRIRCTTSTEGHLLKEVAVVFGQLEVLCHHTVSRATEHVAT